MNAREIEEATVGAFIVASRRTRYTEGLAHPTRRTKILGRLYHRIDDFDERFRVAIPPAQQHVTAIVELLRAKGAPITCYVMSTAREFDQQEMVLADVLQSVIGRGEGALVSCVPGELGYYESEEPGGRFILERRVA